MGHLPEVTFMDETGKAVERKRVDSMSHSELRAMMVANGFRHEPKPSPPGGYVGMYTRPHHFRNLVPSGVADGSQRFVRLGGQQMGVHGGMGLHGGMGMHGGGGPQGGLGVPGVTATQGTPTAQQQATAGTAARGSSSAAAFFGSLLGNSFSAGKVTAERRLLARDVIIKRVTAQDLDQPQQAGQLVGESGQAIGEAQPRGLLEARPTQEAAEAALGTRIAAVGTVDLQGQQDHPARNLQAVGQAATGQVQDAQGQGSMQEDAAGRQEAQLKEAKEVAAAA